MSTPSFLHRVEKAVLQTSSAVCVGIDPRPDRFPGALAAYPPEEACARFGLGVLEAVAGLVPVVKLQSAFFEAHGAGGVAAYGQVIAEARRHGLLVIADVKRADIGSTAEAYAEAHLDRFGADAVTVNPYLGADGVLPFVRRAGPAGKGVLVLLRTSNPSAMEVQDLADGEGRPVYERIAGLLTAWGPPGTLGAVVGGTAPRALARLRTLLPDRLLLVPGLGAQGASAANVAAAFRPDGGGALIAASRAVTDVARDADDWVGAIRDAARRISAEVDAVRGRIPS